MDATIYNATPDVCFVQAKSSFIIPPSTEVLIAAELSNTVAGDVTGIITPRQEFVDRYQIVGAAEIVQVWDNHSVPIRLLNPTSQPVKIYRCTRLGHFSPVQADITTFDLRQSDLEAEAGREVPTTVDSEVPAPLDVHTDDLNGEQ